jgi:micrococcal nuclease
MREMVLGKTVMCQLDGERTYDRCAGVCRLERLDVAEVLVRQGLARDCSRFSSGRYQAAEQEAIEQGAANRKSYELPGYCRRR